MAVVQAQPTPHLVRRPEALVVRRQPNWFERALVILALFISQFGTPTDWFAPRLLRGFSGSDSNPLLVYGSLFLVLILVVGLIGNGEAVGSALRLEPFLVVFVVLVGMSTLWSGDRGQAISEVANFLVSTMLALVLFVRYRLREVIQLVVLASAAGLVLHLVWVFALPSYGVLQGQWVGASVNKNFLGLQAAQSIPFLTLGARAFPRWRFPLYLLAVAAAGLIIGSFSKTSLAAAGLTVGATLVYIAFRARKTLYGAVVLTLFSTSTIATLFATANLGVIAQWLDKDVTLTGRSKMWPLIVSDILDRPILGYGYGGYWGGYLSPAHEVWVSQSWFPGHAHNAAFEVALRVGIVGLVIFVVINVRAVMRAVRLIQDVPGPQALLPLVYFTLALMMSITESGVVPQRFGWAMFVYFTLLVGHSHRERLERRRAAQAFLRQPSMAPASGVPVRSLPK